MPSLTHPAHPEADQEFDSILRSKIAVAEGVVLLTFGTVDGAFFPPWEAGAHIDVTLGDGTMRQYSLCSDPSDLSVLSVAVLRAEPSRGGSRYIHDSLTVGDAVRIRGPRNRFPLIEADGYVFLAGGIGITPIMAMIDTVRQRRKPWRLMYGGRTRASMAFASRLAELPDARVTLVPMDEAGIIDVESVVAAAEPGYAVYCCGPEGLIRAVESCCARAGSRVAHVERFVPAPPTGTINPPFELVLRRTGTSTRVPPDKSVLEVVRELGLSADFSCEEGTCGTCETDVLDGQVDHRDCVLTKQERDSNSSMMICVSRAKGTRLELDL